MQYSTSFLTYDQIYLEDIILMDFRPPGCASCGKRQQIWREASVTKGMHRTKANVINKTKKSSVTAKLYLRSTWCEIWRHFLEQLSWLRNRGWAHSLWHELLTEIVRQPWYILCLLRTEYLRWIERRIPDGFPDQGILQEKSVVRKSAVYGQLTWLAVGRLEHVGKYKRLLKFPKAR